jgi:CheY-like chemotaxis protein
MLPEDRRTRKKRRVLFDKQYYPMYILDYDFGAFPMKILVVDDSLMIRETIGNELISGGFGILAAQNGLQAFDLFISHPEIALITLDVNMEGIDGFETLRRIRQFERDNGMRTIPVVFVTSNDTLEDRTRGFDLGAQDFISKPFFKGQILSTVNRILLPSDDLKGSRILIVDDNDVARYIITRTLREVGAETFEAPNANDALDILRKTELDMVITDLLMPQMSGDVLCRQIRTQLGMTEIPIIILTAIPERTRMIEIFRVGATDYLFKPFIKEELIARLFVHLERSRMQKLLRITLIEKENLISKSDYLISKLKDTNTRLLAAQNDLVEMERQNAVLAMSVTANHEINQPLMIIKGNVELLQSQMSTTDKDIKHFTRIHDAIQRIEEILTKLRNISLESTRVEDYSSSNKMFILDKPAPDDDEN